MSRRRIWGTVSAVVVAASIALGGMSLAANGATRPAVSADNGAFGVYFHTGKTSSTTSKTLSGYQYYQSCLVTGQATSLNVKAQFVVIGKPGVSYTVAGPVSSQNSHKDPINDGPVTTVMDNFIGRTGSSGFFDTAGDRTFSRFYFDLTVFGTDSSVAHLNLRITADGLRKVPAGERRCMIEGTILPT